MQSDHIKKQGFRNNEYLTIKELIRSDIKKDLTRLKTLKERTRMTISGQIAKQFREVYFGGNWTGSNLQEHLKDVTWQQAVIKVNDYNSIATLVYHLSYYVTILMNVLQGEPLNGKDELSFIHPPIRSENDWENLLKNVWAEAETTAALIEQLSDSKLFEIFSNDKYGTYYRNIHGTIQHIHYHLGQIVFLKKTLFRAG